MECKVRFYEVFLLFQFLLQIPISYNCFFCSASKPAYLYDLCLKLTRLQCKETGIARRISLSVKSGSKVNPEPLGTREEATIKPFTYRMPDAMFQKVEEVWNNNSGKRYQKLIESM